MLINAAPRSYTSNIVADADLNLEGYSVTANAIYAKDNYLLTMLDYGEAFPTDVKEGDKLFAWGEDSTTSYIYTYKQGAWDAGVKPQHMQDYYIADENRTVRFCCLKSSGYPVSTVGVFDSAGTYRFTGLLNPSDVYILGEIYVRYGFNEFSSGASVRLQEFTVVFTDGSSLSKGPALVSFSSPVDIGEGGYSADKSYVDFNVKIPSVVTSFHVGLQLRNYVREHYGSFLKLCYGPDV